MNLYPLFEIRHAKSSDIKQLISFFIKAYGKNTIFQNEVFLNHFFSSYSRFGSNFNNSVIALNSKGDIISHYGGIECHLKFNNKIFPLIWGVSAYTLPEYRGKGFNSQMLSLVSKNNGINGVIGFKNETAKFYEKFNFNVFNFLRFNRFIYVNNIQKTIDVCKFIGQDVELFLELVNIKEEKINSNKDTNIVKITLENIEQFNIEMDLEFNEIATTNRSKEFLVWRFLKAPYINYQIFGYLSDNKISAYIVIREEILNPLNYKISRVIDLYGQIKYVEKLIYYTIQISKLLDNIYIDFSMFGSIYSKLLLSLNFSILKEEQCCLLPQVTSPIMDRPNGEYVGLMSNEVSFHIKNLNIENVYFTRMDSDRDRLANIDQIK